MLLTTVHKTLIQPLYTEHMALKNPAADMALGSLTFVIA